MAQLAAHKRIPLTETYFYDPANTPTLELNERAKTESWVRKLPDGRYRVRQVGQHCYLGEGRGLQRNRNGRRYPADKTWGRHTVRESAFMQRVGARRVIGQVEHPDSGRNDLGLAAMLIAEVSHPDPQTGKVFVEWETLSTPGGKILASLIEDRVGFGLSSRGNGSVVRVDGVDEVQEDFEPVTFDAVADESTPGAELAATAIREGIERALADAGGDLNEAIRRDREAAAKAVQNLMECLSHGGEPGACVAAHLGPVSAHQQPLAEAGKVLAESGDYRARAYPTALGQVDIVLEGTEGSRLVEMGLDSMHAAQQRAMHHVAQALQALATGSQDDPAQTSAVPAAGNNPHEPMTMPVGGEWVLGTRDGEGHYRAFEKGPGNHQVWYVGHNTAPVLVASGLRTYKDAKAAAENHLHTVVGEDAMKNEAEITGAQPYAGNAVEIQFDSSEQCKKACRAIKKAGFRYEEDGDTVVVQAENPDASAVMDQLKRVLDGAGIELEENIREMDRMDHMGDMDMMGRGSMDHMAYDLSYMDMDDEDMGDEDMMLGYLPEPDYMGKDCMGAGCPGCPGCSPMEGAMDPEPFVGDPEVGLEPTEDEEDAPSPYDSEYAGQDPEDLDLDLDVNEADGYGQPGKERKNAVAGASTSAKAGGEMGGERRKNSDIEKTGGSADAEKKGGGSDMHPAQRKAKEGGSALPDKGKGGRGGQSMPQKAAKMAEAIPRALADLRTAWANGDGQTAAKVASFLESVSRTVTAGLRERASDSPRVRYLQNEVARLESENTHLRALNEAMTEVQRMEVLEFERKLILRDHPELAEAEDTLKRCDTLDEMHTEKDRLLRLVGASSKPAPVGEAKKDKDDDEDDDDASESTKNSKVPSASSGFQMVRENAQGSVNSLSVEGAPTKPLDESMVGSASGEVTKRSDYGDTASRLVAAKRRRRRG